ncbi:unnamed protein product, partial [Hapterophycus canaliculatus]
MAEKAGLFGDSHALTLIMNTADPFAHNNFGRCAKNFNQQIWDFERRNSCLTG